MRRLGMTKYGKQEKTSATFVYSLSTIYSGKYIDPIDEHISERLRLKVVHEGEGRH